LVVLVVQVVDVVLQARGSGCTGRCGNRVGQLAQQQQQQQEQELVVGMVSIW
jgi:hypothetical protein